MKRGGLGRGLSALIPGASQEGGLLEIPESVVASEKIIIGRSRSRCANSSSISRLSMQILLLAKSPPFAPSGSPGTRLLSIRAQHLIPGIRY